MNLSQTHINKRRHGNEETLSKAFKRGKKERNRVSLKGALSNCRLIATEGFLSKEKVKEARCHPSRSFSIPNQQNNSMFLLLTTLKSDASIQQNTIWAKSHSNFLFYIVI